MNPTAANLKSVHVEMLTRSAFRIARCCSYLRLHCRDPPAASSSLLYGLGYNQYQVRSFWSAMKEIGSAEIEIYKFRRASFRLRIVYKRAPLREVQCVEVKVPIDPADSEGLYYEYAPSAHAVYLYVEGGFSGVGVKVNAERLLRLVAERDPDLLDELEGSIIKQAWGRGDVENAVLRILRGWHGLLDNVLPRVPRILDDLLRLSPVLRRLRARERQ